MSRNTGIDASQIKNLTIKQEDLSPDALTWQVPVEDRDLTVAPVSPSEGDRYLIITGASGDAWAGQNNKITQYIDSTWKFYTPIEGWMVWIKDENKLYKFDGSSWSEFVGTGLANIVEDTTPQLGGNLDMNGHDIGGNTEAQLDDAVTKKHASTLLGTKTVDETDIADTKILKYNSTSGKLEYEAESGGADEKVKADSGDSTAGYLDAKIDDFTIKIIDHKLKVADRIELNIMINAFRIAINGSLSVYNMVDGVSDEFEDETGIDTGASTGETYDSAGDYYKPTPGTLVEIDRTAGTIIGDMTSNGGLAALFDGVYDKAATAAARGPAGTITTYGGKDWGAGVSYTIARYIVHAMNEWAGFNYFSHAYTLTLQGSHNNADWVDLHTDGFTCNANDIKDYSSGIDTSTAYRYHRVKFTDSVGNEQYCEQIQFYRIGAPNNITLISQSTEAEAQPDNSRIVIFEQDVDAITIGTDFFADISRDSGANWVQVTLADEGDYASGKRILTGIADLSGQAADKTMKWRIRTANTKNCKIHGVALLWD